MIEVVTQVFSSCLEVLGILIGTTGYSLRLNNTSPCRQFHINEMILTTRAIVARIAGHIANPVLWYCLDEQLSMRNHLGKKPFLLIWVLFVPTFAGYARLHKCQFCSIRFQVES